MYMPVFSYKHSNGYTGIMYGKSSLAVKNSDGREVFYTGSRNINTLDELKKWLDDFPKFMEMSYMEILSVLE